MTRKKPEKKESASEDDFAWSPASSSIDNNSSRESTPPPPPPPPDDSNNKSKSKSAKKRKLKEEPLSSESDFSPKKKKIKTEPESYSDIDTIIKKDKKNKSYQNENGDESTINDYLNKMVKKERNSLDKEKSKSIVDDNMGEEDIKYDKKSKRKKSASNSESKDINNATEEYDATQNNSVSKRKKINEVNDSTVVDSNDTDSSTRKSLKKKHKKSKSFGNEEDEMEADISAIPLRKSVVHDLDIKPEYDEDHNLNNTKSFIERSPCSSASYDETNGFYSLDNVKNPNESILKTKGSNKRNSLNKEKSKSIVDDNMGEEDIKYDKKSKRKKSASHSESKDINNATEEYDATQNNSVSKKSKKRKKINEVNDSTVVDSNDTDSSTKKTLKKKHKKSKSFGNEEYETEADISAIPLRKSVVHDLDIKPEYDEDHNLNNTKSFIERSPCSSASYDETNGFHSLDNVKNPNESILKKKGSYKSRISNKIQFNISAQPDSDLDADSNKPHNVLIASYLKLNPHLQSISKKIPKQAAITENDDVWELTIHDEIDIKMLEDTNITIGKKCKLKCNDETYVGQVDSTSLTTCNMLETEDKYYIKSKYVNGCINLHKRIPKVPSAIEDDSIVEKTSYTPMPHVKCRHPLFGPNYKAAIKFQEKLNECVSLEKKKKKRKSSLL